MHSDWSKYGWGISRENQRADNDNDIQSDCQWAGMGQLRQLHASNRKK